MKFKTSRILNIIFLVQSLTTKQIVTDFVINRIMSSTIVHTCPTKKAYLHGSVYRFLLFCQYRINLDHLIPNKSSTDEYSKWKQLLVRTTDAIKLSEDDTNQLETNTNFIQTLNFLKDIFEQHYELVCKKTNANTNNIQSLSSIVEQVVDTEEKITLIFPKKSINVICHIDDDGEKHYYNISGLKKIGSKLSSLLLVETHDISPAPILTIKATNKNDVKKRSSDEISDSSQPKKHKEKLQ